MKGLAILINTVFISYILTSITITLLLQNKLDKAYHCGQQSASSLDRKLIQQRDIGQFVSVSDAGASNIFFWGDSYVKAMQTTTGVYELMVKKAVIPKNANLTLYRYEYARIDSCVLNWMARFDIPINENTNKSSFICYKQNNVETCLMSSSQ